MLILVSRFAEPDDFPVVGGTISGAASGAFSEVVLDAVIGAAATGWSLRGVSSLAWVEATGGADQVFGREQLHPALQSADFVILAAPLTPASHHLMNADAIAAMRQDAYLINVSRGPLIEDAALVAALRENRIAGAALDVFSEEPLPADSPYWSLDNVLVTPHIAAVTERLWERQYALISDNLKRFFAGQPLLGVIDKLKGY